MPLRLSIILPCYNVERYVSDCLDSIYNQDLPGDEFEVICVNDCSTDNTSKVLSEYVKEHSNLTIITHLENQTLGGARNSGLKAARGSYIWFVDPDDFILANCLGELLSIAEHKETEILLFNHCVVNCEKSFIKNRIMFLDSDAMSGQEYVIRYTPNNIAAHTIVWCCLYKTSFLHKNNCKFPIMKKGADDSFQWRAMLLAKRVASVEKVYYYYRVNQNSVSHKTQLAEVLFSDRVLNAYQIHLLLNNNDLRIMEVIRKDLLKILDWSINSTISVAGRLSSLEQDRFYQEIVKHKNEVRMLSPYMNRKNRCLFSLLGGQLIWKRKLFILLWLEKRRKGG